MRRAGGHADRARPRWSSGIVATSAALLATIVLVPGTAAPAPSGPIRVKTANLALDRLAGDGIVTAGTSHNAHLASTDPSLIVDVGSHPIVVLVKLDYDALASYDGSRTGLAATSPSITGHPLDLADPAAVAYGAYVDGVEAAFAAELAGRIPSATILRSYRALYGGVAVLLPANQVKLLVPIPGVVAVQRDVVHQPAGGHHGDTQTTTDQTATDPTATDPTATDPNATDPNATDDTDATDPTDPTTSDGVAPAGTGVRVAVLDSGLWPEDPAFVAEGEVGPDDPAGPCDFGDDPTTPEVDPFVCEGRVGSGVRTMDDYDGAVARGDADADPYADSARDASGHGTHVAAVIAGAAPGSQLAIYKVCGPSGCLGTDVMTALTDAVLGGARVVSLAMTGGADPSADPLELALLDVYAAGVAVAAPAGNDGPLAGTVQHQTPWVTTAGAVVTDDPTGTEHVADFSSRGPGTGVLKPDLVAPAPDVVPTSMPASIPEGTAPVSGTSLAAAQVAGAAAVLLAAHPDWTPGMVQSALTTTARPLADGSRPAPADGGAGVLDVDAAQAPGLVFSASAADLGRLSRGPDSVPDLNVATVSIPDLPGVVELTRTATDVSGETRSYDVSTHVTQGAWIQVQPSSFTVDAGGSVDLAIQVGTASLPPGWYAGEILLTPTDGGPPVRLPVSFQRTSSGITVHQDCPVGVKDGQPAAAVDTIVRCTITTTNATTAPADVRIMTALNSSLSIAGVQGAERTADDMATAIVTLPGAQPSAPSLVPSPQPRFLDLTQLPNIEPVPLGDDVGINFTLPEFWYGNQRWTRIGIVSNGYAVVGGVDDLDVSASPQLLPDAQLPNNVLAPFWTDLEGRDGRDLYAATITDASGAQYAVFQWNVQLHGRAGEPRVFQLWVGLNTSQEISFVYDPTRLPAAPAGGRVAIGAENLAGDRGAVLDPNLATGPTSDLSVVSDAGSPAGSYSFTVDVHTNEIGTGDVSTLVSSPTMRGLAADGLWFDIVDALPPSEPPPVVGIT